jgi:hypothetical protein
MFNGTVVDTQPFLSTTTPADEFKGAKPWPLATPTVEVQAAPAPPYRWGDGVVIDKPSAIVTLTYPSGCAPPPGLGRFTGGGKVDVLKSGHTVSVTYGFEVDCDLHQPSNNLEVNWEGNQFHMEDFTAAMCSLRGHPNPPVAPVNTIIGEGTGRYDGAEGYTIIFELVDNGEPGTNDESAFLIYKTSNPSDVVLNVPLSFIISGNIQAHVDQK